MGERVTDEQFIEVCKEIESQLARVDSPKQHRFYTYLRQQAEDRAARKPTTSNPLVSIFIVQEQIGIGDVRYWLATDPESGIAFACAKESDAHNAVVALNAAVELGEESEQARWQSAITDLISQYADVDGAGCESGDPLDVTLSEIQQTINALLERIDPTTEMTIPVDPRSFRTEDRHDRG